MNSKNSDTLESILEKASKGKGISPIEINALFQQLNKHNINKAMKIAAELKSKVTSLYTCLYITNKCVNDCGYCGFRRSNDLTRITLTLDEIKEEAKAIQKQGVTNVILIGGTLPEKQYKDLIIKGTKIVKEIGLIPWIEFENLSKDTLKELHELANHFVLFQETYNKERYEKIHRNSPLKKDYFKRLKKIEQVIEAGFENITIGALFGLSTNYVDEISGLYNHAKSLHKKKRNVCISAPTLKSAPNLSISENISYLEIEKIFTILRLALPEVSLALSGRENIDLRNRLFPIVDQIGTGGIPNPGGRTIYKKEYEKGDAQFTLYDTRTPQEVKNYLQDVGVRVI